MTVEKIWSNIKWALTAVVIPGISAAIMLAVWLAKLDSSLNDVKERQVQQAEGLKDVNEHLEHLSTKIDTIERRQEIYQATHR